MNVSFTFFSVDKLVTVCNDPYEAAKDSYAIVVCTEWDEFIVSFPYSREAL